MTTPVRHGSWRQQAPRPLMRFGLIAFALTFVLAVILDLRWMAARKRAAAPDLNDLVIDAATGRETYRDAAGRFLLRIPAGWKLIRNPQMAPWELALEGPELMSLRMQVAKVDYATLDKLRERLLEIEEEWQIDSAMENVVFKGLPAIQRTVRVSGYRLRLLDLVTQGWEFHLQAAAPVEAFESRLPVLEEVLNGFEPRITD